MKRAVSSLVLSAAAVIVTGAVTFAPQPAAAAPARLARGCQRVTVVRASGNGPRLHWVICNALQRRDDRRLVLLDDGSRRLGPGTVLIGEWVRP